MKRIIALIIVLVVGAFGYAYLHLDGAMITVLIIAAAGVVAGLGFVHKRYGTRNILNGALQFYDPTLPSLLSGPGDTHLQGHHGYASEYSPPGAGQEAYPYGDSSYPDLPGFRSPQTDHFATQVTALPGGRTQVTLPSGMPPVALPLPSQQTSAPLGGYAALPQVNLYELHLGPNAYIDVQQAYINTLLLDPTGNITCVHAEELARVGVPLLFIDVGGSYQQLLREFPQGWRVCSVQPGAVDPQTIPLDREQREAATAVGHAILQEGWQVLFDFASFPNPIEAVIVLWDIIQGMIDWEQEQYERSRRFLPACLYVTEAYRFCPDVDKHSLFRELPEVAQRVRVNILTSMKSAGRDGLYWILSTRKITGMDQKILQRVGVWMIQQPAVTEVQSGWITAFTGILPADLQRIPHVQTLILDVATRTPQLIGFRDSHTRGIQQASGRMGTTFTLPAIPSVVSQAPGGGLPTTSPLSQLLSSQQEVNTPPFETR